MFSVLFSSRFSSGVESEYECSDCGGPRPRLGARYDRLDLSLCSQLLTREGGGVGVLRGFFLAFACCTYMHIISMVAVNFACINVLR